MLTKTEQLLFGDAEAAVEGAIIALLRARTKLRRVPARAPYGTMAGKYTHRLAGAVVAAEALKSDIIAERTAEVARRRAERAP